MNDTQLDYYNLMQIRNRMVPINIDGKIIGCLTYFIGNGNPHKYMHRDPWTIVDDEPDGDTCYIDQLLTNKDPGNAKHSYRIFKMFKDYIKSKFRNVKQFKWSRCKDGKLQIRKKRA